MKGSLPQGPPAYPRNSEYLMLSQESEKEIRDVATRSERYGGAIITMDGHNYSYSSSSSLDGVSTRHGWELGVNQTRVEMGINQIWVGLEDGYQPYTGGIRRWVSTRHGWDWKMGINQTRVGLEDGCQPDKGGVGRWVSTRHG